ncbi:15-cis-phytoene synthase [Roseibaca sp. Y0-43]|uniref:15-cis-phytoene synthase n=1 Tax=Roseibaca sp. Y0-43 TaxID=2816854 RepID=UPI001D0CB6FE|nr:phytoene/squalene synthase family protein [Roseibaca sp. Y0-43]MCC1482164.1 phytoene/squalene synthase family protein [Roseibaca sp. Y0-43]
MTAVASAEADLAECRAAIRTGSLSFHAASKLLPAKVRDPSLVLYAFCRLADDAVDEGAAPIRAVLHLQERLDRAYAGRPFNAPIDRCFTRMIETHALPRALPDALLEGLAWDAEEREYHTLSQVLDYSARVAAVVGVMMCVLMGVRDRHRLARACDLGLAMQLTNIARDVGADADLGRIYLPRDWFAEAGIDPAAFLRRPAPLPEIRAMTARLLREADRLYLRAEPGIADLPLACRPGIFAARHIYAGIGGAVRGRGYDNITGRAHTGKMRKLGWLGLSGLRAGLSTVQPRMATLYAKPAPEVAFLVDAAAGQAQPTRSDTLIDALARLRAQDLARRNAHSGMDQRSA